MPLGGRTAAESYLHQEKLLAAALEVGADAVHGLRFDQAVRGYRMAQVDVALARLADELADRDAEITRLRGEPPAGRSVDDTAATRPGGLSR